MREHGTRRNADGRLGRSGRRNGRRDGGMGTETGNGGRQLRQRLQMEVSDAAEKVRIEHTLYSESCVCNR